MRAALLALIALAIGALVIVVTGRGAWAQQAPASSMRDADILGPSSDAFRVQSVTTRITSYDQRGTGYQAQGGPTAASPGSERTTIFEPQVELVATQGRQWTHTIRVPVDVVTAASPDAIDVMTSASRHVESGEIDWAGKYRTKGDDELTLSGGVHLENPFRSWSAGLGWSRAFADGDTVLSASFLEVFDWFDKFNIDGHRQGRTDRSSSTVSAGLTQILTPTTVANVNYGITLQRGELGNTWNSVPLDLPMPIRGAELLPDERTRHALVVRLAQWLPWNGALHGYYRFYTDDWGNVAHSAEAELLQRITRHLLVGALYRYHHQTGVSFFTTLANPAAPLRTADSDLAPFDAQTFGGKLALELPLRGDVRAVSFEVGYERYIRSNDLSVDVFTCATGYRF